VRIATIAAGVCAALLAGSARQAAAQSAATEGQITLNLEVGAQPQQRTIEASSSIPLYDETATFSTTQPVHNGAIFGGNITYRVTPTLGAAIGFDFFKARASEAAITASIPNQLRYNQPTVVTAAAADLKHTETSVHLQAVWFHPLTDKLDLSLAAGPSIIKVKQDLATNVTVAAGTTNLTITPSTESKNVFGVNIGGDVIYTLNPKVGVGILVRYVAAKADLPSVQDLSVAGLQTGVRLRVLF
jgi:hypothetical protein